MEARHYQQHTLVEVAYTSLKHDITTGLLKPGHKVNIRELNERYGISETPIKQALNRLISEGLIESTPRKGVSVREINWDDIEELLDIRLMMETYYVGAAIQALRADPQRREKMLRNVTEHLRLVEHGMGVEDHFKAYSLDLEFHQMYMSYSGNKRVMLVYNHLGTHDYAYYIYGKQSKEATILGVLEHQEIYCALLDADEQRLQRSIENHIANAKTKISSVLKGNL